jgi:hypothetical protein
MQGTLISAREYLQLLGDKTCSAQAAGQTSQKLRARRSANTAVHNLVAQIMMDDGAAHRRGTHRDEATGSPTCFLEPPL